MAFIPYDLLELQREDLRDLPTVERKALLHSFLSQLHHSADTLLIKSPLAFTTWPELLIQHRESRTIPAEGIMLKRSSAPYPDGRKRGAWWKWKVAPYTIDGVLLYAQKGHGRRANIYSDYTFAVWDGATLLPFAKAYSGLTDEEMREVHEYINKNTKERFGPVRTVTPQIVCEIAFEGISRSPRHKSGVAVRFPRILRLRRDKRPEDADSITTLRTLLEAQDG